MAAFASEPPPPPGRRGRRLFELLEERQEPFLLDAYLQEKGLLFPSRPSSTCWPVNACKEKLPRCRSRGGQGGGFRRRCWLLKCMLTKLLSAGAVRKALNWVHYDEESPNKQLSPVSVLEVHYSCEASPSHTGKEEESVMTPTSPRKDLDILRELVELAYTSALNQFAKSKKQFNQEEVEGTGAGREEEKDNSYRISRLAHSDICNSRREWHELQHQAREIGAQIEEAIFEDIREDEISEILSLHCGF